MFFKLLNQRLYQAQNFGRNDQKENRILNQDFPEAWINYRFSTLLFNPKKDIYRRCIYGIYLFEKDLFIAYGKR